MEIEYEAKFLNADKEEVRARLIACGAALQRPEFLQRRWILDLPGQTVSRGAFLRLRDQGNKCTLTWKEYPTGAVQHPKELEIDVGDFDTTLEMVKVLGCKPTSYQENYRELWTLDGAEICIDTWPFMETYVEVEAKSEKEVEIVARKAGFDWSQALFLGVNKVFQHKYGEHVHLRDLPELTFSMPNPFTVSKTTS